MSVPQKVAIDRERANRALHKRYETADRALWSHPGPDSDLRIAASSALGDFASIAHAARRVAFADTENWTRDLAALRDLLIGITE